MTNRKSHTRFRLVPKSTTLDDLEGSLRTLFQNTCIFWSPPRQIWMKIDPYCQQRRCSRMTLDSGNIRFMRILEGFPREGASNDSEVIESRDFQGFRTLCHWYLSKWGQHYYIVLFSPLSPFHWPQNTWPWMVEWPFYTITNWLFWDYYWLASRVFFTYLL